MRKVLRWWGILCFVSICVIGCSKKETPPPAPVAAPVQVQSTQLPDLEQNKIYLTNRTPETPKDFSFKESPNIEPAKKKKALPSSASVAFGD